MRITEKKAANIFMDVLQESKAMESKPAIINNRRYKHTYDEDEFIEFCTGVITLEEKIISATKSMEKLIDKYCSLKKTHERHVVYSSGLIGVMLGVLVYLFFF